MTESHDIVNKISFCHGGRTQLNPGFSVSARLIPVTLLLVMFFLSGCGSNGFHLRKPVTLAADYQRIQFNGLESDHRLYIAINNALQEAGSRISADATRLLTISNLREGRRVVAYTSERKAREYLIYLKFNYALTDTRVKLQAASYTINLDRTFLYDANFVLGKREEERQIREELYQEAARLILLNLRYARQQ